MSMVEKKKVHKVDVRFTEEEYKILLYNAEKSNLSKSEYIRQAMKEKINGKNSNVIKPLCELATVCNKIVEKCELDREEKEKLVRGIEYIWEQLS